MKPTLITLLAAGAVAGVALTARTAIHPVRAAPVSASGRTPVIVELFTSEGCSSCPPADALLSQIAKTQPIAGADVIALGEHVDYWDHGGWADRFSSRQFSARQSDYSRAFRKDTVYTPQMIVDGQTQFVGSDEDAARTAIARAARQPKAHVSLTRVGDTLSVGVDHLPSAAKGDPADVVLAITESGLSSSVGSGENAGRRLGHSAVVRQLMPLGTVSGGVFTASPTVKPASGWQRGNLSAVVFVQERASRRIVGASEVGLK
jgi:hypothetical protein